MMKLTLMVMMRGSEIFGVGVASDRIRDRSEIGNRESGIGCTILIFRSEDWKFHWKQ